MHLLTSTTDIVNFFCYFCILKTTKNLMEEFSPIQLEELYDENFADIFVATISVIGFIGLISSTLVFLIIFFKSTSSMKKFRSYLLCYVSCNLVVEIFILLYKPIYIPKFIVLYPRGFLSPMNDIVSKILLGMICTSGFGIMSIFMIMLIERYAAMSIHRPLDIRNFYKHPSLYIFCIWVFFFTFTIITFLVLFVLNMLHPAEETFEILRKYIINGETFLNFQPKLIRVNTEMVKIIAPIVFLAIFMYLIVLTALFGLCFYSIRKYSSKLSLKSLENNKMLFKSIFFQFLTMIFMIVIPLIVFSCLVAFNLVVKNIYYFMMAMIWIFPTVDNIVIIVTITPYRRFITNKMMWFVAPVSSQIQTNRVVIVGVSEQSRLKKF